MIGAWMVYALIVGALLALGARALDAACCLAGTARRWTYAGALLFSVLLTGLAGARAFGPFRRAPATAAVESLSAAEGAPGNARGGLGGLFTAGHVALSRSSAVLAAVAIHTPTSLGRFLAAGWFVASVTLLVAGLATCRRLARVRRQWPVTEIMGIRARLSLTTGPVVIGALRPEIVLPRWLLLRPSDEQRLVVTHEGEHVAARDSLLLAGACVATALLPWHPAMWWMLARVRLCVELDCDSRVLRHGIARRRYGALLIDLADQFSATSVTALTFADTTSHLEHRLAALTGAPGKLPRLGLCIGGLCALCTLIMASTVQPPWGHDPRRDPRVDLAGSIDGARTPVALSPAPIAPGTPLVHSEDASFAPGQSPRAVGAARESRAVSHEKPDSEPAFSSLAATHAVHGAMPLSGSQVRGAGMVASQAELAAAAHAGATSRAVGASRDVDSLHSIGMADALAADAALTHERNGSADVTRVRPASHFPPQ